MDKAQQAITDPAKARLDSEGLRSFIDDTVAATRAEAADMRRAIDAKMAETTAGAP
jgi:hypothetical protein